MLEHILRRMGFGASPAELSALAGVPIDTVVDRLLNYEPLSTDHDSKIGLPEYAGITTQSGQPFSANTLVNDARQRWLFRMIHSQRPLEEKMALFWHNHFATAYSKIAGAVGQERATRMMDNDPASLAGSLPGQIQTLRQNATGSFPTMLMAMAKDPAMIYWLDSQLNTRTRPQENFGREIMELFSLGIGNYTEQDVYAAARVFTGFNWQVLGDRAVATTSYYAYQYRPADHDATAKTFTFAIYPDGGKVIPARAAAAGEQDAADLVFALARHPATAARLATRLYQFFVNEAANPDQALVAAMSSAYLGSNYSIKAMLRTLFYSSQFRNPANFYQHYSWPAEFVVRAIKETGWNGFSVNTAMTPMANMGQQLYEPPDVNGWATGAEWVSTSSMLSRMNFASTLAANQKFNLARDAQPYRQSPDRVLEYMLSRFRSQGFPAASTSAMLDYLRSTTWTGTDAQLQARIPGLARLIMGSGEYLTEAAEKTEATEGTESSEINMSFSRRQFVKGGVTAFTFGFAAPQVLCDIAFAQGVPSRNLVVVYLSGGNDWLSTVIPYRDPFYASRRPTLAVPSGNVLQIGTDSSNVELGLHPRLTGLKSIFDSGRLAIMQRTGYANQSRSHFTGFDIWGTANTTNTSGAGWLGRYLDLIPAPVDPLVAWNTQRETPRPLMARTVGVPAITSPATYAFSSPNSGAEATYERTAQTRISSHLPVDRPHLAFVNSTTQAALGTLDRVATVATYRPAVTYPNNGFGQALTAVAGAMNKQIGTKVFWVQTGGFDTHAMQGANQGAYFNLMATLGDGLKAFHDDLSAQGLLNNTVVLVYTEFGRRITENGSQGTDHGAGGNMMMLGGLVRGGIYGTAPNLNMDPANPTLENQNGDVKFETDFRSVYAKILDNWLGANSVTVLGADYRSGAPNIL